MSSMKSKKNKRTRTQRYTSNVFAMFNQAQIQEFKEAFNMIDQNRDGFVDKDDLFEIYTSLGKNPSDDDLDCMLNMAPGPINFTMFLTLFGEKLNGTDPEEVIRNAFTCFDERNMGYIPEEFLKECMMSMGERWSEEMVDDLFHCAPISEGRFDYNEFTRTLKHGARDKDDGDTMKDLLQGQIPTLAQEQPEDQPDTQAGSEACA
ncbi:myosin regulatory light chain 12A-like isoform X2 [Gigantopelta aegis]|nr:myosin regulatory light chain 12A-like isoform X2 [Gigantopelta aegis]XP_041361391.1 myosin regulatory light chain 12A-like isoform X2 [Gigantopelta aegis]